MANIEEIAESRPHLREALGLFKKMETFERLVRHINLFEAGATSYRPESVDAIFESFTSAFDIPEDFLAPLKEAMKLRRIDFTRLPMNETPAFSLPFHEDELATVLFMIGKPFFVSLRNSFKTDSAFWLEGRCPVCNARPSLAFIRQDGGRSLFCSYCGFSGPWHRIGCPNCRNRDPRGLDINEIEEEKGYRIDLCNECRSYVKTVNAHLLESYSPELIDIISIPLDIVAQAKGYRRHSPNPIGMTTMA